MSKRDSWPPPGYPLKRCANGCDRPPKPPSLVICGECMDRITAKMEAMLADFDAMLAEPETRGGDG